MATYHLGHAPIELARLTLQAELLRPITERLLRSAGLAPGMRVLEIGCGAGDVSFLAADLVGPQGRVVGIDRAPEAIQHATERARSGGLRNVTFYKGGPDIPLSGEEPFDFLIGRYVLVHQQDPVGFMRLATANLRPGGTLAFHEPDSSLIAPSRPPIPIYDAFNAQYHSATQTALAGKEAAFRLAAIFADCGLVSSEGFCERLVGLENSDLFFLWRATSYLAFKSGLYPDQATSDAAQLAADLQTAVRTVHGQVFGPDQWCLWAKLPA